MIPDKEKATADAIGNLYRAAFFIAKGNRSLGLSFYKKAKRVLKDKTLVDPRKIKDNLILAEKILDKYKKLIYLNYNKTH